MTFRLSASAALAALALAPAAPALAQPVAPMRPSYSPYYSLFRPGGAGYYYGWNSPGGPGFVGPGGFAPGFGGGPAANPAFALQLQQTNQAIASLQTYLATGVNPRFGITGRGAVFNDLGHWYPQARYTQGLNVGGVGGGWSAPGGVYGAGLMGAGMNRQAGYTGPGIPLNRPAGGAGAGVGVGGPGPRK